MNLKCLAIDDEPLALKQIESYIEKTPFLDAVALCNNAFEAIEILSQKQVDLLLVDINMPDLNGIDLVKSLSVKPKIVFTTAYSEYALEGFQVDAVDYLLKPISYTHFLKAVNKVKNLIELEEKAHSTDKQPEEDNLYVKADYKLVSIHIPDILYIESANEYIKFVLENGETVTTFMRLKTIESELPQDRFMRVHRSFIVNLTKIKAVDRIRIIINPKIKIPVGDLYKENFQKYVDRKFLNKQS